MSEFAADPVAAESPGSGKYYNYSSGYKVR